MYVPGLEHAVERWWSRWVRRGRTGLAQFASDGSGWVLTYTARYRLTAFVLFALFSAAYAIGWRGVLKVDTWRHLAVAVGSVLVWLFWAVMFAASLIEQVTVTPQHLRRRSWRGRQAVAWSDVDVVEVDDAKNDLRIGVDGGTIVEVSLFLDGLYVVADALQRQRLDVMDRLNAVLPPRDVTST